MTERNIKTNADFLQQVIEIAKSNPDLAQRLSDLIRHEVFVPMVFPNPTAGTKTEKLQAEILPSDEVVPQIFKELDAYFQQNPKAAKVLRINEPKGLWSTLLHTTRKIEDGKKPHTIFLPLRGDKMRIGDTLPENVQLEKEVFNEIFVILRGLAANPDDIPKLKKAGTKDEVRKLRQQRKQGKNILPYPVRKLNVNKGVLYLHPLFDNIAPSGLPGIFDRKDSIVHESREQIIIANSWDGGEMRRATHQTNINNMYEIELGPWQSKFSGWELYLVVDTENAWWQYTTKGIGLRQVR